MKYLWLLLLASVVSAQVIPPGGGSVTPTNTVTLTNKTLISPVIEGANLSGTLYADQMAGADMSIKIANCLAALYAISTNSGICVANFNGAQTWSVNPFTYASNIPATGTLEICNSGAIDQKVPIVVGQNWHIVGCGNAAAAAGQVTNFVADATAFPASGTGAGTVTKGTAGQADVITGSGTAFAANMIGCEMVIAPGGSGRTGGIVHAVSSATSLTLGFGIDNGGGAPGGSTYAFICPQIAQTDGYNSFGYTYSGTIDHVALNGNSVAGIGLLNMFGEEGTSAHDMQIYGDLQSAFTRESTYAQNSGPYSQMQLDAGSAAGCASTFAYMSRMGVTASRPIVNSDVSGGLCSSTPAVLMDLQSDNEVIDTIHCEKFGDCIGIGESTTCPIACFEGTGVTGGITTININGAAGGTNVIAIGSGGTYASVFIDTSMESGGSVTNLLYDPHNGCTDPTNGAPTLGLYTTSDYLSGGFIQNSTSDTPSCYPQLGIFTNQINAEAVAPTVEPNPSSPYIYWTGYYESSTNVFAKDVVGCFLYELQYGVNNGSNMRCSHTSGTPNFYGWSFDGLGIQATNYSAAGTPLPGCNQYQYTGAQATVIDATALSGIYVSGGANQTRVVCSYNNATSAWEWLLAGGTGTSSVALSGVTGPFNSGGIPYASSSSVLSASPTLTSGDFLIGGGSGEPPYSAAMQYVPCSGDTTGATDAAAIQAAINAVIVPSTDGTILLGSCTYYLNATLTIPFSAGWKIWGASKYGTTLNMVTSNTPIFALTGNNTQGFDLGFMTFQYTSNQTSSNTSAIAIYFNAGSNNNIFQFQIHDIFCYNVWRCLSTASSSPTLVWGFDIYNFTVQGTLEKGAFYWANANGAGVPRQVFRNGYVEFGSTTPAEPFIQIDACETKLDGVELNGGTLSTGSGAAHQIDLESCSDVQLTGGTRTEGATVAGASGPGYELFDFFNSGVHAERFECEVYQITGTGNATCLYVPLGGGGVGSLTINGEYVGVTSTTAGNYLFGYDGNVLYTADVLYAASTAVPPSSQLGTGTAPREIFDNLTQDVTTTIGDANYSPTAISPRVIWYNTTQTANRTVTLPSSGLVEGLEYVVFRHQSSPMPYTLTVYDPNSSQTWVIPAGTNGAIKVRCYGGSYFLGIQITAETIGSQAESSLDFRPGLMTTVIATKGNFTQVVKASTVDNITADSISLTCTGNPTVTMYECGTSTTCASPTTIGTVTVSATGTATAGTVSSSAITAGDYVGWAITSGTCTALDIAATAQIHAN